MVQPASAAAKTRGYRLDWMLVTMTLVAVLLLAATTIRTSGSGVDLSDDRQSGLRLLTPQEQLLVFEDFRFDARGWSPAQRDIATATRGASLGPFAAETVRHSLSIDPGTAQIDRRFDITFSSDWGDAALSISDGQRAVRLNAQGEMAMIEGQPGLAIWVERRGEAHGERTISVRLLSDVAGAQANLEIERIAEGASPSATWRLDNHIAVGRQAAPNT